MGPPTATDIKEQSRLWLIITVRTPLGRGCGRCGTWLAALRQFSLCLHQESFYFLHNGQICGCALFKGIWELNAADHSVLEALQI